MKLFKTINLICAMGAASLLSFSVAAQGNPEAKIKTEMQKQLGERAKVDAVRTTPMSGLYEVTIGSDIDNDHFFRPTYSTLHFALRMGASARIISAKVSMDSARRAPGVELES